MSTIEGLDDYIKNIRELTKFDGAIVHPRLRWWFRCQQDWSWDLRPGVYRPDFDSRDPLLEEDRLTKERHLFREFNEQARPLVQPGVTEQEMYFIQQHYGMPTRLLDWSIDPLVALYFASEDFSREEDCTSEGSSQTDGWHRKVYADGAVFVVDAYTTVPAQRTEEENKKDKFGIGSVKHPAVQDALNRIAWNEVPFPRFSFPVQAAKRDIRIRNHAGCFTFHVPDMSFLDELKLTIRREINGA